MKLGTMKRLQCMDVLYYRYRIVFFIMVIHGIGILMPWNMLINAKTVRVTVEILQC
jgi:hypothetical protein